MTEVKCKLIADVALFNGNEVLLVKYTEDNNYDHQKGWFLPDELLMEFEHPDEAADRILLGQFNLSNINPSLDHIESFKGKDSSWHMVFHYKAEINDYLDLVKSDQISEYDWFDLSELPDKKEIAHNGWALFTIKAIRGIL